MSYTGIIGFVRAPFLGPLVQVRGSWRRPTSGGPNSSTWPFVAWRPSRLISSNDAESGLFLVEMIEPGGRNALKDKKLNSVSRWLCFAHFRSSLGLGCILIGRCGMLSAALRPVKIAIVMLTGGFRKRRATITSERMLFVEQSALGPRGFTARRPPRSRLTNAARSLSVNCQRSFAVSVQHEFTIRQAPSCERLRNRLPWGWQQLCHLPSWPRRASGWAGLLQALVGGDHGWARSSSSHFDGGALAPCSIAVLSCRHRVFHSSAARPWTAPPWNSVPV